MILFNIEVIQDFCNFFREYRYRRSPTIHSNTRTTRGTVVRQKSLPKFVRYVDLLAAEYILRTGLLNLRIFLRTIFGITRKRITRALAYNRHRDFDKCVTHKHSRQ